jgi:hypothetical protein
VVVEMNFLAHFTFGLFTGLSTYYFFQDWIAAAVVFGIQIVLILDFLFKKLIDFEPLHMLLALLIIWGGSYFFFPTIIGMYYLLTLPTSS